MKHSCCLFLQSYEGVCSHVYRWYETTCPDCIALEINRAEARISVAQSIIDQLRPPIKDNDPNFELQGAL